ncbi:hypothetical protein AAFC00_002346 [Neodothiora populina]|uniref:Asl1-like glycosyl hydrolase catalytic domain-containing protein n=1 Tax=Neodothiora populina TaxID=2781224 RepID=A0ABR3PHI2_9PEZI
MWKSISVALTFADAVQNVSGYVLARSATTTTPNLAQPVKNSGKRGLAYNNPDYTQFFSLSGQNSQVSWAYNWNFDEPNMADFNPALEYIPLMFNNNKDVLSKWPTAAQAAIDNGTTTLFSFNEPDFAYSGSGSNYMDIDTAVETWIKYMEPFAGKARLVAPAVTNVGAPAGLTWLENFISNCTNCTIDAINIHWYSNKWAGANYLKSHVQSAKAIAGGRPIIMSEFGLDNSDGTYSDADLLAFLETALPWLDAQDYIEKYAYFMDTTGYLLNSAGTAMSDSGVLYNNYTTAEITSVSSASSSVTPASTISKITSSTTSAASQTSTSKTTTKTSTTTSKASSASSSTSTANSSISAVKTSSTASNSKSASASKTTSAVSTPTFSIISAYFATQNVTVAARSSLLQSSGNIVINTYNLSPLTGGSDPWWGVLKTINILYALGNDTYVFVAKEQTGTYTLTASSPTLSGSSASAVKVPSVNVPAGSPVEVVAVTWGAKSIATQSVWTRLYYQATTNWGFQINTGLFGVDTMFGYSKDAIIWFRKHGVLNALVARENEWVKF